MKYAFSLVAALMMTVTAPAFAGDHVPGATLERLGLTGMKTVSDERGMQVRGMSGNVMTMGTSIISGILIDPATKSFIFGADANASMATAENAGLNAVSTASTNQNSGINLSLSVSTGVSSYIGTLIGGAGGSAFAVSQ